VGFLFWRQFFGAEMIAKEFDGNSNNSPARAQAGGI
jgi:hypothetical protein